MNFIFFNPDEMRAESLGTCGHPLFQSPNFDRLAAGGTNFNQCHVQHTVCTPSRCSFMTGWYPHVRGHRSLWHPLQKDEPNLLRYLKQAGYKVLWGGKNDLLAPDCFENSVSEWNLSNRSTRRVKATGISLDKPPFERDDPRYYSFLYPEAAGPLESLNDFAHVDGAIEFLKSKPSQPFAIFLPLLFPHAPYYAPKPYHDLYNPDDVPPLRPPGLAGKPAFHDLIRQTRRLDELDDAFFRQINAVYGGMIGVVDELLGQLLDALDDSGLADETTVMAFSDHGDWAGDYGLVEKWSNALDDTLTRVPLIIRTPGGQSSHVVEEPVELFDLMATTLDLAGIEAKHTHFARSLTPQLRGEAGDPNRAVFAEGGYALHGPRIFEGEPNRDGHLMNAENVYFPKLQLQQTHPQSIGRALMVRTQSHKLIHRPGGEGELYDLEDDPMELCNRHGQAEFADVQRELEIRLLDWMTQTSDVTPFHEDPRGFPPATILA